MTIASTGRDRGVTLDIDGGAGGETGDDAVGPARN
jgi:hypothetical protein